MTQSMKNREKRMDSVTLSSKRSYQGEPLPRDWDDTTDVVVVGSGFAGLAAAIEARLAGAAVTVLEKMRACGGNSIIAGGLFAAADTPLQRRIGITDSADCLYEDMLRAGLGLNHPRLARIVAERSASILRWTIDQLGVDFEERLLHLGGHSVPRTHITANHSGSLIIRQQLARAKSLGVAIRLGAILHRLVRGPDGRVQGVLIRDGFRYPEDSSSAVRTVRARKAVILATGGFANDVPFRTTQDPRLDSDMDTTAKLSTTGEGLKEALRVGGMPVHLDWIQFASWTSPDERGEGVGGAFANMTFRDGMIVDPNTGKRCVDEMGDRRTVADALWAAGRPCICLSDTGAVARSDLKIERALRKGVVCQFGTLIDLAEAFGIPADTLQDSVKRYNMAAMKGVDAEFGRTFFPGAAPLNHPPYYAMRLWPKVHHTMGGVQINAQAQVLDLEQQPIPGLYAAGEVTGGIHGACRLGSCAMTECLIFGRIAGWSAASSSP